MNYDKKTPIKVTVEGGYFPDKKIELTMSAEADLSDWIDIFKTILISQTFTEDTVKELFSEEEHTNVDCQSPQFQWKDEF